MMKTSLLVVALVTAFSLTATAQEMTARAYANARGIENRGFPVTLSSPHACTLSKAHPCLYYGGDIDPNDPQENGSSNENTLFIPESWTYPEVNVPVVSVEISATFTNNLQTYGVIDPQTANWDFRIGLAEGDGGTDTASGTGPAQLTDTGRNAFSFEEYELLIRTPISLPKGNVWFDVEPNCTNPENPDCLDGRYFESDTDGLNGINTKFTVTSNNGLGPVQREVVYDGGWWGSVLCRRRCLRRWHVGWSVEVGTRRGSEKDDEFQAPRSHRHCETLEMAPKKFHPMERPTTPLTNRVPRPNIAVLARFCQ
ncbi:MAG: hypothetical protein WAL32_11270 [Terriglobales bacterium]